MNNLNKNNFFYNKSFFKKYEFDNPKISNSYKEFERYGYESKNNIYDIDIRKSDGQKQYRINCGFDIEPTIYHKAIEKHFNV